MLDPKNISILDQAMATMTEAQAPLVGTYYRALLGEGLNEELAATLVRDFHRLMWHVILPGGQDADR
jgi:hypothetical protein